MKKLIILLFIFVGCSSNKNTAYSVEMTLGNGDVITRHYILEDGSKLFLKNTNLVEKKVSFRNIY